MQGSFEKEVQQRLDDLTLMPSAPVWEKVEMEIAEKKKKRRGIFWLLFAGLLIGSGWWGYHSLQYKNSEPSHQANTPSSVYSNDTVVGSDKIDSQLTEKKKIPVDFIVNNPSTKTIITTRKWRQQKLQGNQVLTIKSSQQKDISSYIKQGNAIANKGSEEVGVRKEDAFNVITVPVIDKSKQDKSSNNSTVINTDKPAQVSSVDSQAIAKDSIGIGADSLAKTETEKRKPATVDSSVKKKVAAAKSWRKQIFLNFGQSTYANGISFNKSLRSADSYAYAGGGGTGAIITPDSSFTSPKGFAFTIGMQLSKQLSNHWEFTAGVAYSYYSAAINVGDKRPADTIINFSQDKVLVNEVYTNGGNSYTNRFHIVEVPVHISWQPSLKLPLFLSAGVAYGYLIATNALSYSSASRLYYKGSDDYVRHQLPVSASLQYRFGGKKGISIQAGPIIRYNIIKLQKELQTNTKHFLFAGIQTAIRF